MDPITGIGLAASVVQLVQFSISVAKTCQVIYDQGSTDDNASADSGAGHLMSLIASLQKSLHNTRIQSTALSAEEKDLTELARKCDDCAKRLQQELRKAQTQPQASVLKVACKTIHSIWNRKAILKIQEQLENYRRILETSLLHRLSQRFDAYTLSTNESFAALDQSMRQMINCLAHSQTSLDMLVKQESEQTRQHVQAQVARIEQLHIEERFYDEVLKSLFYPEISSRQEHIANEFRGIEDSYQWIFDEPLTNATVSKQKSEKPRDHLHWANFPEWLKSGSKVYWVNGKAGSGKSTLMNYICEHKRKDELLIEWSAERRLLTPAFFFWNVGVRRQKSVDGLLRSLIYQILKKCPELIACFKNEPLHSWTEKRLLNALFTLLTQTQVPVAICVFIDGLDEFDGQYDAVVEKIASMSNQSHVKICLSSRPLVVFETAFARMPSLKLQDLTFDSIRAYAEDQLSNLIEERVSHSNHDQERIRSLLDEIVYRSEGVFLWAATAIGGIREGLQESANLNELESVIRDLPPGIENLYMQMLNKIKPAYRREAIKFLQIVSFETEYEDVDKDLDLFRLYFIDIEQCIEDQPLSFDPIEPNTLVEACRNLKNRVLTHTMGLLDLTPTTSVEIQTWLDEEQLSPGNPYDQMIFTKVYIHHRTVNEFLVHNDAAKSFVTAVGLREEHVRLCIARGNLAYSVHVSQQNPMTTFTFIHNNLNSAFYQVAIVERLVGAAQSKLIRSLCDCFYLQKDFAQLLQPTTRPSASSSFAIELTNQSFIDLVGMAASHGMLRFISEMFAFPTAESEFSAANLVNFQQFHSAGNPDVPWLSWTETMKLKVDYSNYRQWISEHLEWSTDMSAATQNLVEANNGMLAQTYLLACCPIEGRILNLTALLTLVRVLLQAGADPMVYLQTGIHQSGMTSDKVYKCFWDRWLRFLGHLPPALDKGVKMDDIFNVTKGLLVRGASINFHIHYIDSPRHPYSLNGYASERGVLKLEFSSSAMFWLEKCFYDYPEMRAFLVAAQSPPISPSRRTFSIYRESGNLEDDSQNVYPAEDKSEMLWPLIKKWEKSGQSKDLDQLLAAMTQVFKAHRPDVRLDDDWEEKFWMKRRDDK